jgi:hypothetical protein
MLHEPGFVDRPGEVFDAARQLRLIATGAGLPDGVANPSRTMPGLMTQTPNLRGNANALMSVLSNEVAGVVDATFANRVPLHRADLSGYGLSTFSRWRRELPPPPAKEGTGVTQVRFDVLVGRTSYEVIELQSRLWTPQCRMVRTIILERRNSAEVTRYDSGWNAIEDGDCKRYAKIETGVVKAFRNIRNVRITPRPLIEVDAQWTWQEVRYDADLHLQPEPGNPAADKLVPIRDHVGYIQIMPVDVVAANGEFDGPGTGARPGRVRRADEGAGPYRRRGARCGDQARRHAADAILQPRSRARREQPGAAALRARGERQPGPAARRPMGTGADRRQDARRLTGRPASRPPGDPARRAKRPSCSATQRSPTSLRPRPNSAC